MIYTKKQWQEDGSFSAKPFQQVSEEVYQDLMNAVPPINFTNSHYQVGEAYGIAFKDGRIVSTYSTFARKSGKCYFLGHLANDIEEINKAIAKL